MTLSYGIFAPVAPENPSVSLNFLQTKCPIGVNVIAIPTVKFWQCSSYSAEVQKTLLYQHKVVEYLFITHTRINLGQLKEVMLCGQMLVVSVLVVSGRDK